MNFRLTTEQIQLQDEVNQFIGQHLPRDWPFEPFEIPEERWQVARGFTRKLAQNGWLTPAWPREYGGLDLDHISQVVLGEQLAYHRAPNTTLMGANLMGPTLIVYGTGDQKRRHLPGIASGETSWCQGYSEPNAGSDLASIQTTAVRDGDTYVVNGTKIWSSYAHRAEWCFLLARTDPNAAKHKGISYFLVPMDAPGIEVIQLPSMAGMNQFCQIYFDNVRVAVDNRVGRENDGWHVAMTTLNFERSSIGSAAAARRDFDDLLACLGGSPVFHDEGGKRLVRRRFAEMAIEIEVGRLFSYRVAWVQAGGGSPNLVASAAKLYLSEMALRHAATYVETLGLYGQLWEGSSHAPLNGRLARILLNNVRLPIVAGTSEIQRNIMAQRGLGLGRS
jgi:alkylation response protein AidB-like acyl-CoA dehydrogenase